MRLGLNVGYWGLGMTAADQLDLVKEAEAAGYDSVWAAEAYGSDAATVLAWLAAQTSRIRIGSAIFQMPARSPAMTAMTAATLDQLSGGRMLLGIGTSGPQVAEGWHGQRFGKQLARTREYVEILRKALARERLVYEGETYRLPLPDGPGKALKLTIAPLQEQIPIYIASIGPRNTELTGEIADGWLPIFFSPEHVGQARELLDEGAARAGRSLEDGNFDIAPGVNVCIDDDVDRARDQMRHFIALYVGGMGSRERNFYNQLVQRYGFEDAAREIQELYLDGKKDEAATAVPAELIDTITLVGPREKVRDRLAVYREAGVGSLLVVPVSGDVVALAGAGGARGDALRGGPRVRGLPHARCPNEAVRRGGPGGWVDSRGDPIVRSRRGRRRHHHVGGIARGAGGGPRVGHARATRDADRRAGLSDLLGRRGVSPHGARQEHVGAAASDRDDRRGAGPCGAERGARAAGVGAASGDARRHLARPGDRGHLPAAGVSP